MSCEEHAAIYSTVYVNRDLKRGRLPGEVNDVEVIHKHGRLVPATKAANELGIPYTSLRDLALRGEVAVVRLGRAWYFDRRDLERLVESHKEVLG